MLKSGNSEMPKFRKGLAGAAAENKALRWITPSYGEEKFHRRAGSGHPGREIQGDFDQNQPNST